MRLLNLKIFISEGMNDFYGFFHVLFTIFFCVHGNFGEDHNPFEELEEKSS
jgi:hypothetical protein